MHAAKLKKWLLPLSLVLLAVFMLSAVWWTEPKGDLSSLDPIKVNLALRETGDRLLDLAGDSTSRIAAVYSKNKYSWFLNLKHHFNYDSLPNILSKALLRQGIQMDYNVIVLRCSDNELMLGYTASTYALEGEAPCGGRNLAAECLNLELIFQEKVIPWPNPWKDRFIFLSASLFLVAIGMLLFRSKYNKQPYPLIPASSEPEFVHFGQSSFDFGNQILFVNGQSKNLTFREAKLLNYLIQHANQVLDRERILEAIWQDEGMLVGRSLDVFISRLRKLIKEDSSSKISSVHGVGYRFETTLFVAAK